MFEDNTRIEYIFEKKLDGKDMGKRSLCIALGVFGVFVALTIPFIGLLITIICGIVIYFVWPTTKVEYEYLFFAGELTIDRVFNKTRRKRCARYDLASAEVVAPANSDEIRRAMNGRVVNDYSSGFYDDDKKTGMVVKGNKGTEVILLEENSDLIEAVRRIRPIIVKYNQV